MIIAPKQDGSLHRVVNYQAVNSHRPRRTHYAESPWQIASTYLHLVSKLCLMYGMAITVCLSTPKTDTLRLSLLKRVTSSTELHLNAYYVRGTGTRKGLMMS